MLNAVPWLARALVRSTFHHLVLAINGRGLDDAKMRSILAAIDLCYAINSKKVWEFYTPVGKGEWERLKVIVSRVKTYTCGSFCPACAFLELQRRLEKKCCGWLAWFWFWRMAQTNQENLVKVTVWGFLQLGNTLFFTTRVSSILNFGLLSKMI